MSLTPKQRDLLEYIDDYIKQKHACPSFDEMTEAMRLTSKSGVHRLITALEGRGYIRRMPHRARAIEVIRRVGEPTPQRPAHEERDAYRTALQEIAGNPGNGVAYAIALRTLEKFP